VVLGGASIYGGRGSAIRAIGALLLTERTVALPFLQLCDRLQFGLPGAFVLVAAATYARLAGSDRQARAAVERGAREARARIAERLNRARG